MVEFLFCKQGVKGSSPFGSFEGNMKADVAFAVFISVMCFLTGLLLGHTLGIEYEQTRIKNALFMGQPVRQITYEEFNKLTKE